MPNFPKFAQNLKSNDLDNYFSIGRHRPFYG